eukprot:1327616-Prymnesium_polylepis.1
MQIWQPTQQQGHGVLYLPPFLLTFVLVLALVMVLVMLMTGAGACLMTGAGACCIIMGWGAATCAA